MISIASILALVLALSGLLFALARTVEMNPRFRQLCTSSPLVYALSFTAYCTTWTYYGSVGLASRSTLNFLAIFLGPTLTAVFWPAILGRLVRLKNALHLTSLADFISARYAKSEGIGALVTLLVLVGISPYLGLQLRANLAAFGLLSGHPAELSMQEGWSGTGVAMIIAGIMLVFAIVFGFRRLDPTERHPGMMAVLALESLVKLGGMLLVGAFAVFWIFGGFGDLFERTARFAVDASASAAASPSPALDWVARVATSAFAILFLPRQFHVAVVENSRPSQIRTAVWLVPLYLLAINFFIFPVALAGLAWPPVAGATADTFVLAIPIAAAQPLLSMAVFLGGFSAAMGMVVVETIAVSTMITNHLLLPVISRVRSLGFLRGHLLKLRWAAAAFSVGLGLVYERLVGGEMGLAELGGISFAAAFQLAPAALGGLFWRKGNRAGAALGLLIGFTTWGYTLFMPSLLAGGAFGGEGWGPALLQTGPWGLNWLRPQSLLGVVGLSASTHGLFWSLGLNLTAYVLGSLFFRASADEERGRAEFFEAMGVARSPGFTGDLGLPKVRAADKRACMVNLFEHYLGREAAESLADRCFSGLRLDAGGHLSLRQLMELAQEAERSIAGAIGTAAAHLAVTRSGLIGPEERHALSRAYGEILAEIRITPEELRQKIDFYLERERLLSRQASELEQKLAERDRENRERTVEIRDTNARLRAEVEERKKAQAQQVELYRQLVETARRAGMAEIATNVLHNVGNVLNSVNVSALVVADSLKAARWARLGQLAELIVQHAGDLEDFFTKDPKGKLVPSYLMELSAHLGDERTRVVSEVEALCRNVEHIKAIVSMQLSYARSAPVLEKSSLEALINDALQINSGLLERHGVTVQREISEVPWVEVDPHRILQILVNLINNAVQALHSRQGAREVRIRLHVSGSARVRLEIEDNGEGIAPENLTRIFQHGFTTRKDGHGFGLHGGALAAREMGGALSVRSDGPGRGACFTLELPLRAGIKS